MVCGGQPCEDTSKQVEQVSDCFSEEVLSKCAHEDINPDRKEVSND